MTKIEEIELRKWCLEFISRDNVFESTADLTKAADYIFNWIKAGGIDVDKLDWSGFKHDHQSRTGLHRYISPDGEDVFIQRFKCPTESDIIEKLRVLWVERFGIPNKGKGETND